MKVKKSCGNCLKGIAISVNSDILCRVNGAVSPDYVCSRHKFAPEQKSFKEQNYKCIDCEHFLYEPKIGEIENTIGLCEMFSVRKFDGLQKKACSKFLRKRQQEVG